ncbi:hypothetical protein Megvenef_00350 [Candidatus Megaera venefica]|uniref:Uncharacterized protein n=1 Tax=Candidatus Megaera venefica TaxID=2055910 RepID=A0ABU5NB68_9RICK|nr:hypothetical protein [Candidatus Megaera venefica]MEA0970391.1 hypothetical protein [Candidatus Megaera venefica]
MKAAVLKFRKPSPSRLYYADKKTQRRKRISDNIYRDLQYVTRHEDRNRSISLKARNLAVNLIRMILKNPNKEEFVDHKFLSEITEVSSSKQNANLLGQIGDIIDSTYHSCVNFHGKRKTYGYLVKFTKDGYERATNPETFYGESSRKKSPVESKKISTYIKIEEDTKEVEDRAYSSISSTKEENKIKEETIEPSSLATSSLAELASDLVLHQAGEEIRTEANVFPNQLTTVSEATAMGSAEELEHYASHRHRDSGSGLMAIHELSVMTNLLITSIPEECPTEENVIDSYATTEIIEAEIIQAEEITIMQILLKPTSSKLWQEVREKMMNSYEQEVDRWDLKWIFNELEVEERLDQKTLVFKGSGYVIDSLRNKKGNHWKIFTTSFYEVMPDYSFEFEEIRAKNTEEDHDSAA